MEKHEPLAQVRIRTDGPIAEVFIDGHKVPRVMAFKAEMNAMEQSMALSLTIRLSSRSARRPPERISARWSWPCAP